MTISRRRFVPIVILALLAGVGLLLVPATLPTSDLLRTLLLLVRAAMLLGPPGLALLLWLEPLPDTNLVETLCLAPLVSLALYPLLLFWLGLAGASWSAPLLRLFLTVCSLLVIWRLAQRDTRTVPRDMIPWLLAVGGLFVLALAIRLVVIRGAPYPSWDDSYHHTLITQLILDSGRVPASYQSYAPLDQFHYHFGYHAYSAFLAWATGLPAHRTVLWGGQVLNALTVPSVYLLVVRLARDKRAALLAAVLAAIVCRNPGYYVNWGRHPQLAGQVLLLPALTLAAAATQATAKRWRAAALGGVLAAGLALTHYRVAIFYLVGILVLGATLVVARRERGGGQALLSLVALACLALLLVAPWLPSLLTKTSDAAQQVAARGDTGQYDYITLDFVLDMGLRLPVLIVSLVSGVWLLIRARRRPLGALTLAWLGITILLANPSVSGIPSGFLPNGTVIVALYLPAAILTGLAASDLYGLLQQRLPQNRRVALKVSGILVVVAVGAAGGVDMIRTGYDPWWRLLSNPDLAAMEWVRENTPEDAVFAVGFDYWISASLSGIDGGYWLPYSAQRQTLVPPMVYITEAPPEDVARINAMAAQIASTTSSADLAQVLHSLGIDYVYRGCRSQPDWYALVDDPALFERVYESEGVRVDRVR